MHAKFLLNLVKTMSLCTNLRSLTCTPNILPSLLSSLKSHETLTALRANATLTVQQTKILTALTKLNSLALDSCTWNVVDALPDWTRQMSSSLTTLVMHVSAPHAPGYCILTHPADNTRAE